MIIFTLKTLDIESIINEFIIDFPIISGFIFIGIFLIISLVVYDRKVNYKDKKFSFDIKKHDVSSYGVIIGLIAFALLCLIRGLILILQNF